VGQFYQTFFRIILRTFFFVWLRLNEGRWWLSRKSIKVEDGSKSKRLLPKKPQRYDIGSGGWYVTS